LNSSRESTKKKRYVFNIFLCFFSCSLATRRTKSWTKSARPRARPWIWTAYHNKIIFL